MSPKSILISSTICCALIGIVTAGARPAYSADVTLDSSLTLGGRYDDNLFFSETDPEGGYSTLLTPRVALQVDKRLISGTVRYEVTAEWYRQHSDLNRLWQRGELDVSLKGVRRWVRHLDLELQGAYTRVSELPGTSLEGQPVNRGGVLFPVTTESTEWRGSVIAGYTWTRRLESSLEYTYIATYFDQVDSNSSSSVQTFDSIVHDAKFVLSYQQTRRTTLTLTPAWGVTRVVPSGTAFTAATATRSAARLTVGAEYLADETFTIQADVGAMVIEEDRTRLAVFLDAKKDWSRFRVRLFGGQDSGVGGGVINTISVTRMLFAEASRALGRHTEASVDLGIIGNLAAPTSPSDPTVRVVSYRADAGLARQLARWLSLRLEYSLLSQRSSGLALAGQRHVFSAELTATAPQWRSRR